MPVRLDYLPVLQDCLALCFYLCFYILPRNRLFFHKNVAIRLILRTATLPFSLSTLTYMVLAPCSNPYEEKTFYPFLQTRSYRKLYFHTNVTNYSKSSIRPD